MSFTKRASICVVGLIISLYITNSVVSDINLQESKNEVDDDIVPRIWGLSLLAVHVFCMSLSTLFIVPSAMLLFTAAEGSSNTKRNLQLHGLCNAFAVILIIVGLTTIVLHKSLSHRPHFTSPHAIVGMAVILGSVSAALGGSILLNFSSAFDAKTKSLLSSAHRNLGFLVFVGLCASVFLALVSPFGVEHSLLGWQIERPEKRVILLLSIPCIVISIYWSLHASTPKSIPKIQ